MVGCFATSPFDDLFISSSNIFAIIKWFAFTCFFNGVIMFVVLYKIRPCLSVIIIKRNWSTIRKNTFHDLSLQGISHLHVCYYSHKKEIEHKCFLPCDFQIVLWACNFLMFLLVIFILRILVLFCLNYFTFLQTLVFHYIIPKSFTCIFTSYYHFKKLDHFQFPQENAALKLKKKLNRCMMNWNFKTCPIT